MKIWKGGVWRNGDPQDVLIDSPAFQYGFGLFETIRLLKGIPLDLDDHMSRLLNSIASLDAELPRPFEKMKAVTMIEEATKRYGEPDGVLKAVAWRMTTAWDITLLARPYPYEPEDYQKGFSLTRSSCARSPRSLLYNHKTLNYLENYLERRRAMAHGFNDTYFVNTDGVVTECTSANLFIVSNSGFLTSPVEAGLLPGIMRAKLLHSAAATGFSAAEMPLSPVMLAHAESVFVTNALYGVMPVARIDDITYRIDDALTTRLNTALGRWT